MHALWISPGDTDIAETAVESNGSLVIIILLLLHSSPDGPHLSLPPPSPSPSLFHHIPVFISFPPTVLTLSLWEADEYRESETVKHGAIERKETRML